MSWFTFSFVQCCYGYITVRVFHFLKIFSDQKPFLPNCDPPQTMHIYKISAKLVNGNTLPFRLELLTQEGLRSTFGLFHIFSNLYKLCDVAYHFEGSDHRNNAVK